MFIKTKLAFFTFLTKATSMDQDTPQLDILAFAAHPDDIDLSCSGTLASQIEQGGKAGIIDLTRGEMGTRGTPELREQEAKKAGEIIGLSVRENLGFRDGFITNDEESCFALIRKIRQYRPTALLTNALQDQHPDHVNTAQLTARAFFLSGLQKIETRHEGKKQAAWRPNVLYHYMQADYHMPDFIVDISDQWEKKRAAIQAFESQFGKTKEGESEIFIADPAFMAFLEGRARELGQAIGVEYGEGFFHQRPLGVQNLLDLI